MKFSADLNKEVVVGERLKPNNLKFGINNFNLLPRSVPELNDLVKFMNNNPTVKIRLEGHTDNSGKDEQLNKELSENRVKEVRKYLIEHGIDESRIDWIGYGSTKPINSGSTEALRALNRRVENRNYR